ncbi:ROK family protein [Oceanobacillus senegalensis]|uniref:ROK family protein n=1 Tax=Oceanobacillus senegalensis TaxID=1936063 RepID=UPI000A30C05B|nr:ROK family protein [Oceanobacillus senegalensis]
MIAVFDIGGTAIKYGVVSLNGEIYRHDSFPTDVRLGGEALIDRVIGRVKELQTEWEISGISISTAGQIDSVNGVVFHATDNIPGYTGLNISSKVHEATGLKVSVENDVNCTALGEHWMGVARGAADFLCVTIGTGIGGALFLREGLYAGPAFAAGEIGHINLYPGGRVCTCGNEGCYEQYASSKALEMLVQEKFDSIMDLRDFFEQLRNGQEEMLEVFHQWVDDLTNGLRSVVHMINPELIIIGGGISEQGDFLLDAIKTSLYKKIMPNHASKLQVKMAEYGNKANLLGAVKHYRNQYLREEKGVER